MSERQDKDDDDWFDALAGRPRPGACALTTVEATLLRAAVREWPPQLAPAAAPDAVALIAHARAAGVLGRRIWCAGCAERWRALSKAVWQALGQRPAFGAGLGVAFAAVLFAVVFGVMRPVPGPDDGSGAPVLRGEKAGGVWLLRAADPAALRDRIAAELAAAGVVAKRYERLGRLGLDADVPMPAPAALVAALRRHGVLIGADGALRVEIESSAP